MENLKKRFLWFLAAGMFFVAASEDANAQFFRRWRARRCCVWNSCESSAQVWYDGQGQVVSYGDGGCYGESNPSCYGGTCGDYNRYGESRQSCSTGSGVVCQGGTCRVVEEETTTCAGGTCGVSESGFE